MGLFSALNSSVSGMAAQSNTLTAISQNIANSNTTGYKDVEAQFADVVSSASPTSFNGAGVTTNFAYLNSEQGGFSSTNTNTDLAVSGNGFFAVQDAAGNKFLTRDGSFTPDSSGNLVNSAGYTLLGYSLAAGAAGAVANGSAGLVPVNVGSAALTATPTTSGTFSANLPASSTPVVAPANLPSSNTAPVTYTDKTSVVTYNELGTPVTLDIYMTNTGTDGAGNPTWEMSVYNQADAASGGGFPYTNGGVPDTPLATQTLTFDPTTGALTTPSSVAIPIPNSGTGTQTLNLNIAGMTQLDAAYTPTTATVNGNAPSGVTGVSISADGTMSAVYANGATVPIFDIPLGNVPSPDSLVPISGNVWQANALSGDVVYGTPGQGGLGSLKSSTLELSTTDLATQLTNMIQAQSGYEANSKVFQTSSSLLSELVNMLK
ncbi:flagellar hook protein FlgE [Methyloferula stellata]|uniref:flagellar hook protein FlgE n=1 Tax=Methyloferula stellata TaxID=876270 RepID=UPI0003A16BC2|nr:flagellar hook protein FlgE [Methyloferula stellata]